MEIIILLFFSYNFLTLDSPDYKLLEKMFDQKSEEIKWHWYVLEKHMIIKEHYLIVTGKDSYCLVEYKILRKQPDNTFKTVDKFTEKQFDYTVCKISIPENNNNSRSIIYGKVLKVKGRVLFCPEQDKIIKLYGSRGSYWMCRKFTK